MLRRFVIATHSALALPVVAASLCLLAAAIGATGQTTKIDLKAPYVPVQTASHPCEAMDVEFLSSPSTLSLLADYGYEVHSSMDCVAASVPWLPSARILRINEAYGLDDYREFTLLQGSRAASLWLIPIEFGMVGYPHTADNPHHIAAFNDLLRYASVKPNENLLFELGNLYQFTVGMEEWFDPVRLPKTIEDTLKANDISAMTSHDPKSITFKHREPDGDLWTHSYMVWEFHFKNSQYGLRLASVERGPLDPETDDIKEP